MRDNTQREGNGLLAYSNQTYERIMPTNSNMGDSRLKVKLRACLETRKGMMFETLAMADDA
jgi:hypothetical protein